MKLPIYMDDHATTAVDPRVLDAMIPTFLSEYGNASSQSHCFGWHAEKFVENARAQVAHLLGAEPSEIVFTSGATESNNLALKGAFETYRKRATHIITQVTEHKSVLDTCKYLEKQGARVTYLKVDATGMISLDELKAHLSDDTLLISIMAANNEVGTIQPLAEIGALAKSRGILFHVDAAQAAGKLPINVETMGIDLLSLSAHKMYGPKGVGALYIRSKNPNVRLAAQMHGGGQEHGLRSGTLNVPAIVGLGRACEIAMNGMAEEAERVTALRERLHHGLNAALDGLTLNGHPEKRLPGNLNLSFASIDSESLLNSINEQIAISTGSACTSKSVEPSYVLKALGLSGGRIHSAIRFGVGRFTTTEQVDYVVERVANVVKKIRQLQFARGGQMPRKSGTPSSNEK